MARPRTFTYEFPRPAVAVDCVLFGFDPEEGLRLLVIRRRQAPFADRWALPGGFVRLDADGEGGEGLDEAALRELREETGANVAYLEQLYTFGAPRRDPRGRVLSVAYMALVRTRDHRVRGGDDAAEAKWIAVPHEGKLAFDHDAIVELGVARLQAKLRYAPIGFNLLPPTFALSELQRLYEAVLQRPLDKRNFRRRILSMDLLAEAGRQEGVAHRAATLYRFDERAYARLVHAGFNFEL
jgi:8-oxo-dGTP diphosphatase